MDGMTVGLIMHRLYDSRMKWGGNMNMNMNRHWRVERERVG